MKSIYLLVFIRIHQLIINQAGKTDFQTMVAFFNHFNEVIYNI